MARKLGAGCHRWPYRRDEALAEDPIDLDALLAPLDDGEGGAGIDLRSDYSITSPYQLLRDARAAARAEERARDATGDTELPPADGWRDVSRIARETLAKRSKDFEIAAWLTEALVRQHGLIGLRAGARLIAGLCNAFWDGGFPQPDMDEPEEYRMDGRAAPIGGLSGGSADGTVMQPLRRLALLHRADGTALGIYQWDQAEETEAIVNEERKQARRDAGVPELATLEAEAGLDLAHTRMVLDQARGALEAWRAMEQATDACFGSAAPSTRNVTVLLERIIQVAGRLTGNVAGDAGQADSAQAPQAAGGGALPPSGGAAPGVSTAAAAPGAIRTREDALRELGRIADYFRATEPHSPLAYTLADAVRRGRMTLPELLAEIIPDQEARDAMLSRLGIRPPSSE